jgi:iron-sulfur cluster assembly protein
MKEILSSQHPPPLGVRIGVRRRGCNGMSYTMDYATSQGKFESCVEKDGVRVFVDPKSEMYLAGMEIDYVEDDLAAEFVFRNPNAKNQCGCGESFTIGDEAAPQAPKPSGAMQA